MHLYPEYTLYIPGVIEMSADFSCGGREHAYKYFNTMNLVSAV